MSGRGSSSGGGYSSDDLSSGEDGGCSKSYKGPINSPRKEVLSKLSVGDILQVSVAKSATNQSILVVKDQSGSDAGSLTFAGVASIIRCIVDRKVTYTATIITAVGGFYTVHVEPDQ
jgi:hypothetical protein